MPESSSKPATALRPPPNGRAPGARTPKPKAPTPDDVIAALRAHFDPDAVVHLDLAVARLELALARQELATRDGA